jgi:hypothetical protein
MEENDVSLVKSGRTYDAYVLVYSVASLDSFRSVELALEQLSTRVDFKLTPIVVAAAQIDRVDDRSVELQDGEDLSRRYAVPVTQVSAQLHQAIDTLMEGLVREYVKKKRRRDKSLESSASQPLPAAAATSSPSTSAPQQKLSHRCLVTREIRDTEAAYVQYLERAITCFKRPLEALLKEKKDKAVVSDAQISNIFYNVEDIYTSQKQLLDKLTSRLDNYSDERTLIGDLFIEHVPTLRNHIDYVRHHQRAIITVNDLENRRKEFVAFCEAQKTKHNLLLGLLAHLITPCQRIPRYRLLLQEVLKRTEAGHPDKVNLERALVQVEQVATAVNEAIREQENFQKVVDIQKSFEGNVKTIVADGRLYVRDGVLMKVCKKVPKPRHFFLFSDSLVYAEVESDRYVLRRQMPLTECGVKDVPDSKAADGSLMANGFQVIGTDKSFTVLCATPEEKRAWISDLAQRCGSGHGETGETSAPVWVPDTHTTNCMTCDVKFTTFNRRHHCRKCGACVCGKCSSYRTKLLFLKDEKPVRVCVRCWDDIQEQEARRARLNARYNGGDSTREAGTATTAAAGANGGEAPIELAGSKEHKMVVSDLSKVLTQRKATGNGLALRKGTSGNGGVGAAPQPAGAPSPVVGGPARPARIAPANSRGALLSSAPGPVPVGRAASGNGMAAPGRLQRGQSTAEVESPGTPAKLQRGVSVASGTTPGRDNPMELQRAQSTRTNGSVASPPQQQQQQQSNSQPSSPRRAAASRTGSRGPLPVVPVGRRARAGAAVLSNMATVEETASIPSDTSSRSNASGDGGDALAIPSEPTVQIPSAPPEPPGPVLDDDDDDYDEHEPPMAPLMPDLPDLPQGDGDDGMGEQPPLPVEPDAPDAPAPIGGEAVLQKSSSKRSARSKASLADLPQPQARQLCRAILDVEQPRTGRLVYRAGTEIVALEAVEGKYWRGELADGTVGIFSLATIELLDTKVPPPVPSSAPPTKSVEAPAVPTSKPPPVPSSRPPGSED